MKRGNCQFHRQCLRNSLFAIRTFDDYDELGDLEKTLDDIPDFLAIGIMADYRQIQSELQAREAVKAWRDR